MYKSGEGVRIPPTSPPRPATSVPVLVADPSLSTQEGARYSVAFVTRQVCVLKHTLR